MAHLEPRRSMAGPFVCEKLDVLPRFLYHIEHANSQANHSGPNIEAADPTPGPLSWSELEKRAQKHQIWHNKRPSCFVSAFEELKHARNWGSHPRLKGPVYMYTIDTRLLPRSGPWIIVLRMPNSKEYLFLGQIPHNVIVAKEKIEPPMKPKQTVTSHANAYSSPARGRYDNGYSLPRYEKYMGISNSNYTRRDPAPTQAPYGRQYQSTNWW